ncbi:MAG: hypothetical protein WDO17_14800 [Alphaproteobacteria bacterium]
MLGEETPRTLFVSEEVFRAVTSPFDGYPNQALHSEFRQTLDAFLEGGEMSVGDDPKTKASDALMARVCPVDDGFFDFRITSPHPQIRAFGGFAEKDTFVAITWNYRDAISDNFDAEVSRCKIEWQKLFGSTEPFKGKNLDEHLSNWIAV